MAPVKTVEYGEVFGVYILDFKDGQTRKGIFLGTQRRGAMIVTYVKD